MWPVLFDKIKVVLLIFNLKWISRGSYQIKSDDVLLPNSVHKIPKLTRSSVCSLLFNWHSKFPNLPAMFSLKYHCCPSNHNGSSTLSWRNLSGKAVPPLQWITYFWDCVTAHSYWFLPEDLGMWLHKVRRYGKLCSDLTEKLNVVDLGIYRICLIRYFFFGVNDIYERRLWVFKKEFWGYWNI